MKDGVHRIFNCAKMASAWRIDGHPGWEGSHCGHQDCPSLPVNVSQPTPLQGQGNINLVFDEFCPCTEILHRSLTGCSGIFWRSIFKTQNITEVNL